MAFIEMLPKSIGVGDDGAYLDLHKESVDAVQMRPALCHPLAPPPVQDHCRLEDHRRIELAASPETVERSPDVMHQTSPELSRMLY